jgi:hypothetical protein
MHRGLETSWPELEAWPKQLPIFGGGDADADAALRLVARTATGLEHAHSAQ